MAIQYAPDKGEKAEDFTAERCAERRWDMAAYIADRYSNGRAYLVGDTAHVIPPIGGFGGNTGIP